MILEGVFYCSSFVAGYKSSSLNKVSLKKYQKLDATPKMFNRVYLSCFYAFVISVSVRLM